MIKPGPLKPAVEGGFTVDDFTVDERAGTVTCPAGVPGPSPPAGMPPSAPPAATARCGPVHGRQRRPQPRLHPQDAILRAARARWAAQPALREDYRKYRPNVERVISQVASRGGRRLKLRYLGTTRNNAWLKNRTAALNLRTLISRGLARENGRAPLCSPVKCSCPPQALPARRWPGQGTPGRRRALPGPGRCSELSPPKEPDGV